MTTDERREALAKFLAEQKYVVLDGGAYRTLSDALVCEIHAAMPETDREYARELRAHAAEIRLAFQKLDP